MFVIDDAALAREAARRYLEGKPTDGIAERCLRIFNAANAAKVVDFGAARARLRPKSVFRQRRTQ
jgi:hypothetical protein